jgi:hypothetical protein
MSSNSSYNLNVPRDNVAIVLIDPEFLAALRACLDSFIIVTASVGLLLVLLLFMIMMLPQLGTAYL